MTKTEAIILTGNDFGEADRVFTVYSKEFGKICILAKGVKKLESKLRYHLEPLSYSYLILIGGKSLRIVKDAVLIDQFLSMRNNLKKITIAKKITELLNELIVGEEQDENIWNLLVKSLKIINTKDNLSDNSTIISDFKNNLIELLGYDPDHTNLQNIY